MKKNDCDGDYMAFYKENLESKNEHFNKLRQEHAIWKNELMDISKPFFMIPTDFSHLFLKDISGGALKLYLFLGFHSKYRTGESWYTNEQIGLFFEKDIRTVTKWFKELEDLGLIFRAQKGVMMKANTFLRPFGLFVDEENTYFGSSVKEIKSLINKQRAKIIQGIVMSNGIQETNLIIISKNENLYPVLCFFDLNFEDIKEIKSLFKGMKIPIDNFEINTTLSSEKYIEQIVYKNVISYLDEKKMWL